MKPKGKSVDEPKPKINNCIANSIKVFIVETIKTSTKGKRNFHISEIKLIWLISKKTLKAILRLLKAAKTKLAE